MSGEKNMIVLIGLIYILPTGLNRFWGYFSSTNIAPNGAVLLGAIYW